MKNNILFLSLLLFFNCNKEDSNNISQNDVRDLHNFVLYMPRGFIIDLDNDTDIDVSISGWDFGDRTSSECKWDIRISNDCEISIAEYTRKIQIYNYMEIKYVYDTIIAPRIYRIEDEISSEDIFSCETQPLFYEKSYGPDPVIFTYIFDSLMNTSDMYIAFRKQIENDRYSLGWLKIKSLDYHSITLSSYKLLVETNKLKIH